MAAQAPMTEATYYILLALMKPGHGYGMMQRIKELLPGEFGFMLISGDDGLTVEAIKRGGVGVISVLGNAYPAECKEIVSLAQFGNIEEAEQKLKALEQMITLLFEEGNPVGIKCALSIKNLCGDTVRLPLAEASDALRLKMTEAIHAYDAYK